MSITDEQLQAIRDQAISQRSATIAELQGEIYANSQDDGKLKREIERLNGQVAELRRIGDYNTERIRRWEEQLGMALTQDGEGISDAIAELRKPVAVERNEAVEAIRAKRAAAIHQRWIGADVDVLLSAYDTLAQDCARYANAHAILTAQLDHASGVVTTQEGKIVRLEERERQLREVLQEALPPHIKECCDECGADESKCPADCYVRKGQALLARAALFQPHEQRPFTPEEAKGYSAFIDFTFALAQPQQIDESKCLAESAATGKQEWPRCAQYPDCICGGPQDSARGAK